MAARVVVNRYNSRQDRQGTTKIYSVPEKDEVTVLQALHYIYEYLDPTLAFEYSCRYARCGLCGVVVNERPALACTTFIREKETTIMPLANLPRIRDLVVDRSPIEKVLREGRIYFAGKAGEMAFCSDSVELNQGFEPVNIPAGLVKLLSCLECLCCHSACPNLDPRGGNLEIFAGPYIFLKLAQLHLDPRDREDRKTQARRLGIEKCLGCQRCFCPQGIPIYREAIQILLN